MGGVKMGVFTGEAAEGLCYLRDMKKIAILSIDGGGIRGIIPATILVYLEKALRDKTNNPALKIGDVFDLIAGTSTGGILASLYLAPGDDGHPKYSAEEALKLYVDHGQRIFHRTLLKRIESLDGVVDEKYSAESLYDLLREYFGNMLLSQFVKPSLITSYDITARQAVFFTSWDARGFDGSNFFVRDVARATSAAPTYFEPAHIQSKDERFWTLVDGGMFANNPALCAYAEALKIPFHQALPGKDKCQPRGAKDMLLVSLGTGCVEKPYTFDHFKRAGAIKWLEPVIDILMSGNSDTVAYELKQLYSTLEGADKNDYYRIEPGLLEASSQMDDAGAENIVHLRDAGLHYIQQNKDSLDAIAEAVKRQL